MSKLKKAYPSSSSGYWLTPPEIMKTLDDEFHFDFDPCPCPRPEGYNSLTVPWGKSNYVNPPFCLQDGPDGCATAFVRKAIKEREKGNRSVIVVPVLSYVEMLVRAGAEIRPAGRINWLHKDTKKPWGKGPPCCIFILK